MTYIKDADDGRTHYVYRAFTEDGELLYVGCARDVPARFFFHGIVARHAAVVETEEFPDKASARAAERAAITEGAPLLNKQHNPKRFKAVQRAGFVAAEPIHPITAELVRSQQPVTMEQKLEALQKVSDLLGLDTLLRGGAA